MPGLFYPLLFLHVLGAIVALGPAFAFPVIGAMAGREPQHGNFATRLNHLIEERVVVPFIILTGVTGISMIVARGVPVLEPANRWLLLSIALYAAALAFSWFVQRPAVLRVIALTGGFPDAGRVAAAGGPMPAGGPSPELLAATGRSRRNGIVLTLLSIAIVFLMVMKPSPAL